MTSVADEQKTPSADAAVAAASSSSVPASAPPPAMEPAPPAMAAAGSASAGASAADVVMEVINCTWTSYKVLCPICLVLGIIQVEGGINHEENV